MYTKPEGIPIIKQYMNMNPYMLLMNDKIKKANDIMKPHIAIRVLNPIL